MPKNMLAFGLLLAFSFSAVRGDAATWTLVDDDDLLSPPHSAIGRIVTGNVGCTGTLIAPNVVLSAAHCLVNFDEDGVIFFRYNEGVFYPGTGSEEAGTAEPGPWGSYTFTSADVVIPDVFRDHGPNRYYWDYAYITLDRDVGSTNEDGEGEMVPLKLKLVTQSAGETTSDAVVLSYPNHPDQIANEMMHESLGDLEFLEYVNNELSVTKLYSRFSGTIRGGSSGAAVMVIEDGEYVIQAVVRGATACSVVDTEFENFIQDVDGVEFV